MEELSIQDDDGNELRFNGELVIESETVPTWEDGKSRKFIAKIYAVDGGGFVALLQYDTSCPAEESLHSFEEIDFADDVEKFYYVFEPSEIYSKSSEISRDLMEQRPALVKQIAKQYETMVFGLLERFRELVSERGFHDRVDDSKQGKKASFWKSLGMS